MVRRRDNRPTPLKGHFGVKLTPNLKLVRSPQKDSDFYKFAIQAVSGAESLLQSPKPSCIMLVAPVFAYLPNICARIEIYNLIMPANPQAVYCFIKRQKYLLMKGYC